MTYQLHTFTDAIVRVTHRGATYQGTEETYTTVHFMRFVGRPVNHGGLTPWIALSTAIYT